MSENPVVIVGAARTPMGGMLGVLSSLKTPELGTAAIRAALDRAGIAGQDVDEVMMGCVLAAGLGQAPARQASIGAGIPVTTPTTLVSKVCGSGMKAIMMAADALSMERGRVMVAGGMESMSNCPYLLDRARNGYRMGHAQIYDHMFLDGLQDAYSGQMMGFFGEQCAEKYQFTREMQDDYALESLRRANAATADGHFAKEIVPVTVKTRSGEVVIDTDEQPRLGRPEKIPTLKPAFKKDGTVTAANASSISDGAAAVVLMRQSEAERRNLKPLAVICGQAQDAREPDWFTTAPIGAMTRLLENVGWSVEDVDLFEVNEAFAVVAMVAMREMNISHDRINIFGGACALGHPLGASGARILVTLLNALRISGKSRGVASLCVGGGEATAVAVEML